MSTNKDNQNTFLKKIINILCCNKRKANRRISFIQSLFGRKISNVTNVSASSLNDEKWIHLKKDILYLKNINEWDHFCVEFKNNNIELKLIE